MMVTAVRPRRAPARTLTRVLRPTPADLRMALGECGLTTAFMFTVSTLVRWGAGPAHPGGPTAGSWLRGLVVSTLVGLTIVGFVLSRPGRWTGAQMNPAITLALLVFGRMPARRVLPYVVAQMAASVAATVLARAVWGPALSDAPVRWTVIRPAAGIGGTVVAVVEAAVLAVIIAVLCRALRRAPRVPLPWLMGLMFGLQGALLGQLTGGSANPARQFGPALLSGQTHLLGVYLLAPVAGAVLAAAVARCTELRHR
ncbi:aquaporin [Actinoplanes teichomyceticus]|uniref:Glycerol uptake facilitator protein/aquaporin Z n=1 Tax=Actinoplanes teichomyceticus TaxID=1867 RepID=A0A561VCI0_ACTTI|nr:aquaporin [Actinoplanes teichomyceticus]TWG09297.1 glycerol uptake facilitator protein/aquaporin Z [Actinoplanes teichomyceticus]GIF16681.1 hypothetical protein Ate01nite_67130 [Actinoplanes teichomyceticus]